MADLNRRQFLTRSWERAGADHLRWVRPPFALPEQAFLAACTRCGACAEACPHDVIFDLPARVGAPAGGTPALDLMHKGCHLCADMPCVAACETGALGTGKMDEADPVLPMLAKCAVSRSDCLAYLGPECGACAGSCPVPGALTWQDGSKPVIDPILCRGCALCREACITHPKAIGVQVLAKPEVVA